MVRSSRVFLAVFILITVFFCYFRLKPIYHQTVPYTYDQGRDFLKTEEVVKYKNITFIGPTTGIPGIYHGAWWYYYLAAPYVLFQGHPMGFIIFIFLSALAQRVLFTYFVKRAFGVM